MERQSVVKFEPDKDQSDSSPGFLRSVTTPPSVIQEINTVVWLPYLTGRDLAGEQAQ
jgi:hypothetical protein